MDPLEKRYCPQCGALMIRKQLDYTMDVGSVIDQSYGTARPLPAHHVHWECPNCPSMPLPPPGPPPEFFF